MNFLNELYSTINALSRENQMLSAAISLWGLSVLTYVFRNIPTRIFRFIYKQTTTSFIFNNTTYYNQSLFNKMVTWVYKQNGHKLSRTVTISTWDYTWVNENCTSTGLNPGYGRHFFFYKKRLYWCSLSKQDSQGTVKQKEELTITTYGRSHENFIDILKSISPPRKKDHIDIYVTSGSNSEVNWIKLTTSKKRDLKSVITSGNLKERIIEDIKKFEESEEWYLERGFSYKDIYMLHGPTGTGKTSLIKAVASNFNKSLYILDPTSMSNQIFRNLISEIPSNSICVIEDFDSINATKKRNDIEGEIKTDTDTNSLSDMFKDVGLTLSGVLNTLDGLIGLHNVIIFLTTNSIDSFDPALLRKGRVDHKYYVGLLNHDDILKYINVMYPGYIPYFEKIQLKDMKGCDIHGLFLENRDNPNDFVSRLLELNK